MFNFLGASVDVEDIRAARLRRLTAQQSKINEENSSTVSRTESTQLHSEAPVFDNEQSVRRRVTDKSEDSKGKSDETVTNNGLRKARVLNANINRTEKDCQPQLISTERSLASGQTATAVMTSSLERCPVMTSTGVTSVTSDQRTLAENVDMIDKVNIQEELLKSPSLKTPGTILLTTILVYLLKFLKLTDLASLGILAHDCGPKYFSECFPHSVKTWYKKV